MPSSSLSFPSSSSLDYVEELGGESVEMEKEKSKGLCRGGEGKRRGGKGKGKGREGNFCEEFLIITNFLFFYLSFVIYLF